METFGPAVVSDSVSNGCHVVIDDNASVDTAATEKLRDKMRSERGETGLFSFGGTIEELKARSLEETHLPAPESPHG